LKSHNGIHILIYKKITKNLEKYSKSRKKTFIIYSCIG